MPVSKHLDQVYPSCASGTPHESPDLKHACLMKTSKSLETVVIERLDRDHSDSGVVGVHLQTHASREISNSLKEFLESYMGPISIRASILRQWRTFFGDLTIWLGPIMVQRWTSSQDSFYEISDPSAGFGLAVMMQLPYFKFYKAAFTLLFMRGHKQNLRGVSVQWNLSFPHVVPKDASIMRFARTNDVEAIKYLFQTGQAAASDTTLTGTSLLHVSFTKISKNTLIDEILDRRGK